MPSRIGKVPIQAIITGREKEATVNEIVRIFDHYAPQVKDTAPFRVLLSELCENVLAHSELTTPGYICARILENNYKCEIAIADAGIGVEQSFKVGTNQDALRRIAKGESAIDIALEGLSSSKPQPGPRSYKTYFGFGLFIARRLVEENRGRITLMSGGEAVTVESVTKKWQKLVHPWRGTFVGIVLDLANPLPLERVYAEAEKMYVPETVLALKKEPPKPLTTETKIDEVVISLRSYGTQLLTRELGTAIRADVASQLAAGHNVRINLDGIEDITPSCVDEAFGKLSESMGYELFTRRLRFDRGQNIVNTLIQFVLKTRKHSS